MEGQDFLTRTNSIMLGTDYSRSTMFTIDAPEVSMVEWLNHIEIKAKGILQAMFQHSDFSVKYDLSSKEPGCPMIYVQTMQPSKYTYVMEAFPAVVKSDMCSSSKQIDELGYNSVFESVIERYTKSNQKPNSVLRDTRSSEFCFRLTVKVEAVPQPNTVRPHRFILLREFLILQHLWESYRREMVANVCGLDQMIGFPMPFEFRNVVGSELYDFNEESINIMYYDISGQQEKFMQANIPPILPNSSSTINSSLSYMSLEKMGPSLSYLVELMRTQGKGFTLSSALKIYDQIICRLMIMHRYGVVHCDPNPACLFFGPGESCNVLYISEFGSSVLKPEKGSPVPRFHDRFVSHMRFRERKCHFVHDMESAFYIFLYLLLGRLPWDMRMADKNKQECATTISMDVPAEIGYTDKTVTFDGKEKFWNSQDIFNRTFRMIDLEFHESLYKSFSVDLVESLYAKTKETIHAHSSIHSDNYIKEANVSGTTVYNIYFGLRRIIATYFRFESLSPALKDSQGSSKLELLNKQTTKDCRIAWDLSHWCWNHLDPRSNQLSARSKISQKV